MEELQGDTPSATGDSTGRATGGAVAGSAGGGTAPRAVAAGPGSTDSPGLPYRRVLLKLSGEALVGQGTYGIDPERIAAVAGEIREAASLGVEVAVVVGAGNIFRGVAGSAAGMDRAAADYMGMIATVMNSMALQDALEKLGVDTRLLSAIAMQEVAEPYIRRRAIRHLEKGRVVIFAAGTGNPYFTTDTAAALRALEIGAEAILMAKKRFNGVYDADPERDPDARMIPALTHRQALERGLKVMDATALTLCMDNDLPLLVFSMSEPGRVARLLRGERLGSVVSSDTDEAAAERPAGA